MENPCDMILQILPLAMIASNERLIVPSPGTYKKVAFEVYSRCAPSKDIQSAPYACAPAVQLAGKIPRTIDFSLTSTPTANLSHAQRCIHVAYYWNPHAQWLSASWTDNLGCQQWNACYRIATDRTQSWPTFEEAAKEIWDTTTDIIDSKTLFRRVFLVKGSSMSRHELNSKRSRLTRQAIKLISSSMALRNISTIAIQDQCHSARYRGVSRSSASGICISSSLPTQSSSCDTDIDPHSQFCLSGADRLPFNAWGGTARC